MPNPVVVVWGSGQLLNATSLPQFNQTSGMLTRSIQISNNSDLAIVFKPERGIDIIISARYQLNAPLEANTQYSISLASGQVGSGTQGQVVSVSESQQESTYSTSPLTAQAAFLAVTHTRTTGTNVAAGSYPVISFGATQEKPAFTAVRLTAVIRGSSPGAAEARCSVQVTDGVNDWRVTGTIADEGEVVIAEKVYASPTTSAVLDATKAWNVNTVLTALVGNPAIDFEVELEWVV